jgi:hypothetical protein
MDLIEFLLFIPLLIYGIAVTDLLSRWRRLFDIEHWYAPYIITVIAFTETAVWNIYNFLELFTRRESTDYPQYLVVLAGPLLLLLAVNSLVQEDDGNNMVSREEFLARVRKTYLLMGFFVVLHLLPRFRAPDAMFLLGAAGALTLFVTAIFRREWLVYVVGGLWAVGLVHRLISD